MPRYGLLLVVLAAATLDAQSGSNQPAAVAPSQARPASPAVSAPVASQPRKVELVASPTPRSLDEPPVGITPEAAWLLSAINLCDPFDCLGDAPKLVSVDGNLTIHFPDTYEKPATQPKDAPRKEPAAPQSSGGPGPIPK